MPVLRLTTGNWTGPGTAFAPNGVPVPIFRPQFRCFVRLPNALLPQDALIDTGAPMTCFPERIWSVCRAGVDFEWLTLPPGPVPTGVMAGWRYTFRLARFLAPVTLLDYTTEIDRVGVVAAFAVGNPPVLGFGPSARRRRAVGRAARRRAGRRRPRPRDRAGDRRAGVPLTPRHPLSEFPHSHP